MAVREPPEPGERGRTRVADRVAEKVAARAAAEVDLATGVPRQILGVRFGADGLARVDATVDGGCVMVRVALAVRWPASVRQVTQQVRDHVTERLETLTGLRVGAVDIEVCALVIDPADRRLDAHEGAV